jgi:ubiquinone/menaquinone biosynthesis C-methylase UbiE
MAMRKPLPINPTLLLGLFWSLGIVLPAVPYQQPNTPSSLPDARFEAYQRATDLLATLQLSKGDWAADVGAGGGYYSMRLSELVGLEGKVFAEDISDSALRAIQQRIEASHLENVEALKGQADDPKLPLDRLDAILIVDSYHHFTNPQAMLDKMLHSLKPGGRLVIADYSGSQNRTHPREAQLQHHEIAPEIVRAEVEERGFRVVHVEEQFVKWKAGPGNTRGTPTDLWLLIAVRPK